MARAECRRAEARWDALRYQALSLSCLLLALPAFAERPQPSQAQDRRPFEISVQVRLVVLPVSVTDRKGNLVPGLTAQNFHVYEDGQSQQITLFRHEDIPVTVGLVVDDSSSMRPRRSQVIQAASVFARLSNPQDQMFVVNFNENASLGLPENIPFTDEPGLLTTSLTKTPGGGTALYDAVALGLEHLKEGSRSKRALIVVSDGGDDASNLSFRHLLRSIQASDAVIYTVGLLHHSEENQNPKVLGRLAKAAGGKAYFPESASEIPAVCEEIARDLRQQYTIGYVPPNPGQAAYRKIRVQVSTPDKAKLIVRTRSGYFMPKRPVTPSGPA